MKYNEWFQELDGQQRVDKTFSLLSGVLIRNKLTYLRFIRPAGSRGRPYVPTRDLDKIKTCLQEHSNVNWALGFYLDGNFNELITSSDIYGKCC